MGFPVFFSAGSLELGKGKADEEKAPNGETLYFERDLEVAGLARLLSRFSSSSELEISMTSPATAALGNGDAEEMDSGPEIEALGATRLRILTRSESVLERRSEVSMPGESVVMLEWRPGAPLKAGLGLGRDGTELDDDIGSFVEATG
jgi:hypothetical protein